MIERHIGLDIYVEYDGSAEVVLYDGKSTYNTVSIDNGGFEKWLDDNVTGWTEWMQEGLGNEV